MQDVLDLLGVLGGNLIEPHHAPAPFCQFVDYDFGVGGFSENRKPPSPADGSITTSFSVMFATAAKPPYPERPALDIFVSILL